LENFIWQFACHAGPETPRTHQRTFSISVAGSLLPAALCRAASANQPEHCPANCAWIAQAVMAILDFESDGKFLLEFGCNRFVYEI
jgi:hypothetical protein